MPSIDVDSDLYIERPLGRSFSFDELQDLLFDFGLELEEEYTATVDDPDSDRHYEKKMYKIDVSSNRYDLLCGEGIARALKSYLGSSPPIMAGLSKVPDADLITIHVSENTGCIRPFIVGAVLRDITFTRETYDSFIGMQEKLHVGLCRERSLASMGTHDLDKISAKDIYYDALPPSSINFVPLNKHKIMNGHELMDTLKSDSHLNKFLHIIKESPLYPVVLDANKKVLSLPPIINSDFSKITLDTKNVFVECTATDINKAKTFVDVFCTMFSEYCKNKFTIYPVKVVYGVKSEITPTLEEWNLDIDMDYVNSFLGTNITKKLAGELLLKMGLSMKICEDGNRITVRVPPTRRDIISESDIVEDIAIAYGYKNIKSLDCPAMEVGSQQQSYRFSSKLRNLLAIAGYIEVLTFALCSKDENSTFLRKKDVKAVVLSNPKAIEYEVVRTSLAPSMLKTLSSNQSHPLPIKIFEIADVVHPVSADVNPCMARNEKHLCALIASKTPCFEIIHGLCDWLMSSLGVEKGLSGYAIHEDNDTLFMENRSVSVTYKGSKIGNFGVIHPEVLENFGTLLPCSLMELDLTPFINNPE